MTQYKKMLIKRDSIMPLIEKLSRAYNESDNEYVILNASNKILLVMFDDVGDVCVQEQ